MAELQNAPDILKAESEKVLQKVSAEVEALKKDLSLAAHQNSELSKEKSELQGIVDSIPQQISEALEGGKSSVITEYKSSSDFVGALHALFVPVLCSGYVQGGADAKEVYPDLNPSQLSNSHLFDKSMEEAFSSRLEEFKFGVDIGLKYVPLSDPAP